MKLCVSKILIWVETAKTTYENREPFHEALEQIQGSAEKWSTEVPFLFMDGH